MAELIEVRDLVKVFPARGQDGSEIVAANNVNFKIAKGDIFGIIGLSGAGKSTLVRCLNLLERPTSGEVIIDGKIAVNNGKIVNGKLGRSIRI